MICSFGFGRLVTPGPCIICGAPFGACTPESVLHQQARQRQVAAATSQLPAATDPKSPPPTAPPPPDNPTFSTKTYRGELKRRRSGGR